MYSSTVKMYMIVFYSPGHTFEPFRQRAGAEYVCQFALPICSPAVVVPLAVNVI